MQYVLLLFWFAIFAELLLILRQDNIVFHNVLKLGCILKDIHNTFFDL